MYFKFENIKLLPIEEHHLIEIQQWINDENLTKYMTVHFPVSFMEQKSWLEKLYKDESKIKLIISVDDKDVGMISLINIDHKNKNSEIGIYIIPKYQKNKYAFKVINKMLNFVFREMNMHKIYVLIYKCNVPSIKLFEKLGFTFEGSDRESVFYNNKYHDINRYSIFKRDFLDENNI